MSPSAVAVLRRLSRRILPPSHGGSGADPAVPDPPSVGRDYPIVVHQIRRVGSPAVRLGRETPWTWRIRGAAVGSLDPTAATGSSGARRPPAWGRETPCTWRSRGPRGQKLGWPPPAAGSSGGRLPWPGARTHAAAAGSSEPRRRRRELGCARKSARPVREGDEGGPQRIDEIWGGGSRKGGSSGCWGKREGEGLRQVRRGS
jgi:hypothetical protein